MFEIQFAEKHVYWVDPGKVKIEQVTNELVTSADPGLWDLGWTWAKTTEAIVSRAL